MNKLLLKTSVLAVTVLLLLCGSLNAQNSLNSGDFSSGSWGSGQSMSASAGGTLIITKSVTTSGDKYFRFYGDGSPCGEYQPDANGDAFTHSTTVTTPNGNCGSSNAWKINVPTASSNVVFKTDGVNDGIDKSVAFVIQGTVQSISTVARTTPAQDVAVTVTATLSGALSTGQDVYMRYTNNGYSTSTVVKLTGSGTTYTGTIPAGTNTAAANVSYYLFTSGTTNVASDGSNADLYTINLNNNGGGNYTYTVPTTYYSKGNLAPNTAANWNTKRDGTGTNASNFTSGVFVIQGTGGGLSAPHTMTSGSTMTLSSGVTMIIESGAKLKQTANITFAAGSTFQMNTGSTLEQNSSNASTIVTGTEIWQTGSTVEFTNSGIFSSANISGAGYQNVKHLESSGTINASSLVTLINGDFTTNPTTASRLWRFAGATGNVTCTIKGNVYIQNGGIDLSSGSGIVTLNLEGNLIMSGGTLGNSGGAASSINFTKAGTATYTKSAGTINAHVINWNVNSGCTLDMGTSEIDAGTGTFTLNSGAGIITANVNATGALTTSGANGSVKVTSTRTYNTGANYTFNGASAQVAGNGFVGAANLTLNNSAGLTLSAAVPVTGTLALTSGKITLGANNLTLTGATVTGASSSNYIVTNSTGSVLRSIASGGGSFAFPIGRSSSAYNPLTITNTGGTTSVYTIGTAATTYPTTADGANAQWSIASGSSTTSSLAFSWTTADAGSNLAAAPGSGLAFQYNGATWDNRSGTTVTGTPNVCTVTGITNLTNPTWTIAMPAAVPDIALADNSGGQVATGTIDADANTTATIYNFQTAVTTSNATINSVAFTTTNSASDITNYKLLYASTNSFGSAAQIGSTISSSLGTGTHTFSGLTQSTSSGSTGYFWITADVPSGATAGNTIVVSAITTSDLTYSSGNKTGSTSAGGTQTIIKSPTVTTGSATNISTTDADVAGTVNANASATTGNIEFEYGTSVSYGATVTASPSSASGTSNTSVSKTGLSSGTLTPNTLYHYRLNAANAAGAINGSDASFTTLPNPPTISGGNSTSAAGTVGATIFTAYWTAPTGQGSETFTYTIEVDNDNAFGSVDFTQSGIGSGTTTASVTGLTSGVTYYYRVKSVNTTGSSSWSSPISSGITTTSSTVPVLGATDAITVYTTTTLDGGGVVISDGGASLTDRGLIYNTSSPAETGGTKASEGGTTVSTFTKQITGLTQNTLYYVKSYASNSVGDGYGTTEDTIVTLKTEPSANGTVSFSNIADVTMDVSFSGGNGDKRIVIVKAGSAPSFTPSDITSYTGASAAYGSGTALGGGYLAYNGSGTSFTLTGLTKNTTYHFLVYEYSENSASVANYYATGATGSQITLNPTITKDETGFVSNFGNIVTSTSSTSDTIWVAGAELVSNITVTAPSLFEVSTDNSSFSGALNLTPTAGTVSSTPIYVRFSPTSDDGAHSGNVVLTATNASTLNVAVSGNAISTEPTATGTIGFGTVTSSSIVVDYTLPGSGYGNNRIIVVKAGSAVDWVPTDGAGISGTVSSTFTTATDQGGGNRVVYNGSASGAAMLTVSSLTSGTTYHFAVYEYNVNSGTSQNYYATPATANQATVASSSATDYFRSVTNGNWGSTSTWESSPDNSTWIPATLAPDSAAASISILGGDTVIVSTNANGKLITVNSTGQLTINSSQTFAVGGDGTGTADLTINGYLLNNGTVTLKGTPASPATASVSGSSAVYEDATSSLSIPTIAWASGSTLKLSGTYTGAGTQKLTAGSYQNIIWTGVITTSTDYVSIGDNAVSIAGKLTASGTGAGALLTSAPGASPTVAEYEQTSGIVFINRNSGSTRSLTVTGNATVSGGTLHIKTSAGAGAGQLIVGGNLNVSSGATLTNSGTAGSAALQFNGSSAQTWSHAGTFSGIIAVSTITNAGGVTLNTNLTLPSTSSLTLTAANFTVASGYKLTFGGTSTGSIGAGRTLTVDGTLERISNGTFTTTGTLSVSNGGKYQHAHNAGTVPTATWNSGSICEFTGITATNPSAGMGQSFHHVYWNCASQSGTVNLSSALTTVNGNFEVQNTNSNILRLSSSTLVLNISGNLVISGSNSTVQASSSGNSATINVTGDVTIGSTGTLTTAGNAYTLGIGGNWSNSGTFTSTNSTITFNGGSAQSITKTGGESFNKLTINNTSATGVTVNNDITVSSNTAGALTLTDGELITGSNKVIISGSATTVIGGGGAGTFVNGNLQRAIATGTNAYAYPVGTSGKYAPASLAFTSVGTGGSVTVNTTDGDEPNLATATIDNIDRAQRYWTLTNASVATYTLAPTFTYNAADLAGGTTPATYVLGRYNSGWTYPTLGTVNATDITATGITVLDGNYQAGKSAVVPVVTLDPTTQNICDASSVTFNSDATGTPTPTVQWQVSTNGGSSWSSAGGASTSKDYTFTVATTDNGYQYRAIYTNNKGADTTAAATLTVTPQPTASAAGSDQGICSDGSATLAANSPSVGTGVWSIATGSPSTNTNQFGDVSVYNTSFTPGGGAGSYSLVWSISNSPCTVSRDTVVITVSGVPTTSNAGTDQNICDLSSATLAANTPGSGTGAWSIVAGSPSTNTSQFDAGISVNNTTFTPDGGVGTYTLVWTISNSPCTASSDTVVINVIAAGQWVGPNTGGLWSDGVNWCGGSAPTSSSNITIPSGVTISITDSSAIANSVTINSGGSLVMNGTGNLTITSGGSITNSGTFTATSSTGAVIFAGSGTVTGTITFGNVELNGSVAFSSAVTIGTKLQLNSGGVVSSNSPAYSTGGSGATLVYNSSTNGSGNKYLQALEWPSSNGPVNVILTNGNWVEMNSNRNLTGNLTVTNGALQSTGQHTLTMNGTTQTITVSNSTGGAIYGTDNGFGNDLILTVASGSTTTWTGDATGGNDDEKKLLSINVDAGGTLALGRGILCKYGTFTVNGTLQMNANGYVQQTPGGDAKAPTYAGTGSLVYNSGGSYTMSYEWSGTGSTVGLGVPYSVTVQNTGTALTIGSARSITGTLTVNSGTSVILGAAYTGASSIAGTLQLNSGGTVSAAPTYAGTSYLKYNQGGSLSTGNEWTANGTTAGSGIPQNVTIQNSTTLNMPAADRGLAGNIDISNGTLALNSSFGNDLFVGGSWNRSSSGTFTPNDRAVFFVGSSTSTIKAPESLTKDSNGSLGGETFPYLIMDKTNATDTVKLLSNIAMTKTLTLTKGTFDLDSSDVALVSKVGGTADIGQVLTPSNIEVRYSSTGRFIAQRYIGNNSAIRTWRFLTAPLQADDTVSIRTAWQEGQTNTDVNHPENTNPWPGYGTHITGPKTAYNASLGFDAGGTSTGYSIEYYDNTGASTKWSNPPNSHSTRLMSQLGWGIFIRGDRSFVIGGPYDPTSNTTLEAKGKINIGEVTSTVVADRTNLVGNPFPCQINMENVEIGGMINSNYSLWDPKAYSNYTNTGKFIPFTWTGSAYTSSNSPVTTWITPGTVESGEAFFAGSATSSIVFHESDKVPGTSSMNGIQSRPAAPASGTVSYFRSNLAFLDETISAFTYIDGTLNLYNPTYNTLVNKYEDVISPTTPTTTGAIRILKDGYQLSISKEKNISTDDTIHLFISTLKQVKHRLALSAIDYIPDATALLIDNYTNTSTPVSIANGDTTFVDFDITEDLQSNRSDRFMIIFKPTSTTPVKFSSVRASQQSENVAVEWKIENELNTKSYEVEKSTDGIHFATAGTISVTGLSTYNWLDTKVSTGANYYRIKCVNTDGSVQFSQLVKVTIGKMESSFSVYPNPIVGNSIGLQLTNLPKGKYGISLMNSVGQIILNKSIQHNGGSSTETLSLPKYCAKGIYKLEIVDENNVKTVINLKN